MKVKKHRPPPPHAANSFPPTKLVTREPHWRPMIDKDPYGQRYAKPRPSECTTTMDSMPKWKPSGDSHTGSTTTPSSVLLFFTGIGIVLGYLLAAAIQ